MSLQDALKISSRRLEEVCWFIPWKVVWIENFISTPCRIVSDASEPIASRCSLNDILAKAKAIWVNYWDCNPLEWQDRAEFHMIIRKMYNSVKGMIRGLLFLVIYLAKEFGSKEISWRQRDKNPNLWRLTSWRLSRDKSTSSECCICRWLFARRRKCRKSVTRGRWTRSSYELRWFYFERSHVYLKISSKYSLNILLQH